MIKILLTKGQYAEIDENDRDLASLNWCTVGQCGYHSYAMRRQNKQRIYMHRLISERVLGRSLKMGEEVDHIDGDGLNNKRSNVRVVNHRQNIKNMRGRHHGIIRTKQLPLF